MEILWTNLLLGVLLICICVKRGALKSQKKAILVQSMITLIV